MQSELPQGTENLSAFAQVRSTLSGNAWYIPDVDHTYNKSTSNDTMINEWNVNGKVDLFHAM